MSATAELIKVQKVPITMLQKLENHPYKARLKCLRLFRLEKRKPLAGDMIEAHKIMHDGGKVERKNFCLPRSNTRAPACPKKWPSNGFRTSIKKNGFIQHVVYL